MSELQFPTGKDHDDIFFPPSLHIPRKSLDGYGYRYWSNDTVSNSSTCILVGSPLAPNPALFNVTDGTWFNATWCDWPLNDIGPRGITSLGLIAPYGLALILSLVCLRRLGQLHLPSEKRFRPVGRRWQWYWTMFVCAFAIIGLVMNVDVDRAYVLSIHIIISCFTWFLMQMGATAIVWEAVRHWGSWRERLIVDPDPFAMRDDDRRSKVEFFIPLVFYLFLWINFFIIIPRNWNPLQLQRAPTQTPFEAEPMATDVRFKAAGFVLCGCFAIIVFSLHHSIRHYFIRRTAGATTTTVHGNTSIASSTLAWVRHVPPRIAVQLVALAGMIVYQILCAFFWDASMLNVHSGLVATFVGGHVPMIVILLTQCIWGICTTNEDRVIIKRRREREVEDDRELGIVRKPAWWRLRRPEDVKEALARRGREISGRRPGDGPGIAPSPLQDETGPSLPRVRGVGNTLGATGSTPAPNRPPRGGNAAALSPEQREAAQRAGLMLDGPPPPSYSEAIAPPVATEEGDGDTMRTARSDRTGDTLRTPPPPQQVRSMLDV